MRLLRVLLLAAVAGQSGCVLGYGHCLFLQPVKVSLAGKVRFRDFPAADGVDNVPLLVLDRTEYVYDPALNHSCQPMDELQLAGVTQFPADVVENTRVTADGSLIAATTARQHTRFVLEVTGLLPKH
jgi:hypothetical protein